MLFTLMTQLCTCSDAHSEMIKTAAHYLRTVQEAFVEANFGGHQIIQAADPLTEHASHSKQSI